MPENPNHQEPLVTKWTAQPGMFGEDLGPNLFTEQAPAPSQRSSAARIGREYKRATWERQQADDLELVQVAAQEQDDDEALAAVLRAMRRGDHKTSPVAMAKARRALERRGYVQGPTAERLARMAGQGPGWRQS
jgi:hypothetical protein